MAVLKAGPRARVMGAQRGEVGPLRDFTLHYDDTRWNQYVVDMLVFFSPFSWSHVNHMYGRRGDVTAQWTWRRALLCDAGQQLGDTQVVERGRLL